MLEKSTISLENASIVEKIQKPPIISNAPSPVWIIILKNKLKMPLENCISIKHQLIASSEDMRKYKEDIKLA